MLTILQYVCPPRDPCQSAPTVFEILILPGTIRNPGKRADEEIHTPRLARWKHGSFRLRYSHAGLGEELLWSARHSLLPRCFW